MKFSTPKLPYFYYGLLFLMLFSACSSKTYVTRSRLMMGHVPVNITVKTKSEHQDLAIQTMDAAYKKAEEIESKLSEYNPSSEISCLNQKAGKAFCDLSPETVTLIRLGQEINAKTEGAFDIRFTSKSPQGRKGMILLLVNEGKLTNSQTRIGIASLAKGYILDRMIEMIQSKGFDAIIDAGGDIRAQGGPWKVAIQIPNLDYGKNTNAFEIANQALTTSGNYENKNNVINPENGQAVEDKSSVSVIANTATLANALSTAFYVLGEVKSAKLFKQFSGIEMIWADSQGTLRYYCADGNCPQRK